MKMAVASMEMAPGAIPRPGKVPKQRLLSPELGFRMAAELWNFSGEIVQALRVFASGGISRQKGGDWRPPRGPHHPRAPAGAKPTCGALVAPLRLPFGLQVSSDKIGASVNFRPIPRIFPE